MINGKKLVDELVAMLHDVQAQHAAIEVLQNAARRAKRGKLNIRSCLPIEYVV